MLKKIFKYMADGVTIGCFWFVIQIIILDAFYSEISKEIFENFAAHAFGSMAVGMAGCTTAIVYHFPRLRYWQQILIHLTVCFVIFFPVAFFLNWLPKESLSTVILSALGSILIFFIIWSIFYIYNKYEAKRINEQLKKSKRKK